MGNRVPSAVESDKVLIQLTENTHVDPKTVLIMPGKKLTVTRLVKRAVQVAAGAALSAVTIGACHDLMDC